MQVVQVPLVVEIGAPLPGREATWTLAKHVVVHWLFLKEDFSALFSVLVFLRA